jgi:hypothetical protein
MPGFLTGPLNGFMDRPKGKGLVPSSWLNQIGKSSAYVAGSGNAAVTAVGTPINPGSINNDNVLVAWTIPANLFDIAGRGLMITAMGSVANNTNSKRIKIIWGATTATVGSAVVGGTTIADTGAYTTTGAAGWQISAQVFKYGAQGSNTQIALHQGAVIGSTNGSLVVPSLLTSVESGSVLVAITGNAVTTASDIGLNFAELFVTN